MNEYEVRSLELRLKEHSESAGDCLIWTGATNDAGYGRISFRNRNRYVHKLAWKLAHPDEDSEVVMHTCDNPPCFKLEHLKAGTQADNNKDKQLKGRGRGRCSK